MGTKGPQLERKFPLAAAAAPHLRCLFLSNLLTKGPPATTSQSQAAMVEKSLGVPANLVKIFPWCKIMTTFSNLTKFGNSSRRLQDYKFPAVSSSQPLFRCNVLRNMFCRYRCETASLIMLRMKGTGIYSPLARTKAKAARARNRKPLLRFSRFWKLLLCTEIAKESFSLSRDITVVQLGWFAEFSVTFASLD